MKKLLCIFTLACLSISATIFAEEVFTDYPAYTTALAYDGQYFWIGQEYKVLKWDKNAGILAEYTPKDGLPGPWIREISVAPDKKTVWAASDSSIARFDGTSWHTFTVNEGVSSGPLGNTAFERDGSIWILTKDGTGVFRYNGNTWKHFTSADGLASDTVYAVAVDSTGVVWIGTDNGVSTYDGSIWKTYTVADGLPDTVVTRILVDKNNVKWFGIGGEVGGVARFDGLAWTAYNMDNGKIEAKSAWEMVVSPDNTLWMSMMDIRYVEKTIGAQKPANGIYLYYSYRYFYDGQKFVLYDSNVYDGVAASFPYDGGIVFDTDGKMVVASSLYPIRKYGGADKKSFLVDSDNVLWALEYSHHGNSWLTKRSIYDQTGLLLQGFGPVSDTIYALSIGVDNSLYVGSQSGIAVWKNAQWKISTSFENGILDVNYLAPESDGDVWLEDNGPYRNNLVFFQWPKVKYYSENLPSKYVKSIAVDKNDIKWIGLKENGAVSYDGSTWTQYTTADGLINDAVNAITVDSSDSKWFGTSAGISRYDGSTWTSFPTAENGNPVGNVSVLAVGSTGILWAGTNNGLLRYDGSSWTRFTPKEGLADTLLLSLAVGSNGVVWAGTANGLSRYDGKEWKTFTTSDGLPSNRVQALAVDHNGVIWIGTDKGLVSYTDSESPNFVSEDAAMPSAFPILSVYPNPFNPSTVIECTLSTDSKSELAIYALTGQKVRTLASEYLPSGKHQFRWDGKDDSGQVVSSGVYIAKLKAGNFSAASKMVLVK